MQYTAELIKIYKLSSLVSNFELKIGDEKLDYLPGQFIKVNFLTEINDPRSSFRFFSLTSNPNDNYISFTTKNTGSVFKSKLFNLSIGNKLNVFGPLGRFTLDTKSEKDYVLIAGGIGITPFVSMINYFSNKELKFNIYLFVSFKSRSDLIYYDQLSEVSKINSKIKIIYTLTKEQDISGFESGRIDLEMIKKYVGSYKNCNYLVSGPPVMVESFEKLLLDNKINSENIMLEKFTGY